jgi:hypothetical protein
MNFMVMSSEFVTDLMPVVCGAINRSFSLMSGHLAVMRFSMLSGDINRVDGNRVDGHTVMVDMLKLMYVMMNVMVMTGVSASMMSTIMMSSRAFMSVPFE